MAASTVPPGLEAMEASNYHDLQRAERQISGLIVLRCYDSHSLG